MVNEQITDELQRREIETMDEYNRKISKLTKIIQNKETYIANLEKSNGQSTLNNINTNNNERESNVYYKYIVEPNEQMIIMNEELTLTRNILKKLFKKNQELKVKNLELVQINYVNSYYFYNIC